MTEPSETQSLIRRWCRGDSQALGGLLGRHLAWLRSIARSRMGPRVRRRCETMDLVHDAALQLLRYQPRHPPAGQAQLRALLGAVVTNVVRSANARELDVNEGAVDADALIAGQAGPGTVAEQAELVAQLDAAVERLPVQHRCIVKLRLGDSASFADIGARLGLSAEAARKRYTRAVKSISCNVTRDALDPE